MKTTDMRRPAWLTPPCARSVLAGALMLTLASCASFKGIDTTGKLRAPEQFVTETTLPAEGGNWPALNWPEQIGGAPLQALVEEALANNPNLESASARIASARALAEAARASAGPTTGARFNSTYQRFTEHGLIPPPLGGTYATSSDLALNYSYDLDFWGRHAAELRAALSQGKAAEAEQYTARLIITTALTRAWVQLARQYAQTDLIEQQIAVRQNIDKITRLRFAAGLDTRLESEQTRQQLAGLRAEQAQWQESIALTRNQLAALIGKGPDRGLQIARPVLPANSAVTLPDNLPVNLLARRPDIIAARWRVEAAQGDIENARARFYPNINIAAFAGFSSLGLSELLNTGSRVVGVGPAIELPVFESGSLRANLKGRVAAYDAAVATYNQAINDALHESADQVQSLRAIARQEAQQREAVSAATAALDLARKRERAGTSNRLPVFGAEMTLLLQRKAEVDLQARRIDSRIALIKALGGGFQADTLGLAVPATEPNTAASNSSNRPSLAKSGS